jgi:U3 small nucleolar RNA-associated protein 20
MHHFNAGTSSHFYASLTHWRQLNLSPAFLSFAGKAEGLSASMGMLLLVGGKL